MYSSIVLLIMLFILYHLVVTSKRSCTHFIQRNMYANRVSASISSMTTNNQAHGCCAIASLVHRPVDFNYWLNHHFRIGIDSIFLCVEDTPELKDIIDANENSHRIFPIYLNNVNKTDNWHTLQKRQHNFCEKIIKKCREEFPHIWWLFQNIDDDELIHAIDLNHTMMKIPKHKQQVFLPTIEAVFPTINMTDKCFETTNTFVKCDGRGLCTSYYGGKSAGRISAELRPFGPHQFQGEHWSGVNSEETERDSGLSILHFESCTFERWKRKYANMNMKDKKIPKGFNFYNESVEAVASGDESRMMAYYKSKKVDPFTSDTEKIIKSIHQEPVIQHAEEITMSPSPL